MTGQARKKLKPWRYEKEMEFLIPCFQERAQLSNLEGGSDSNDDDSNEPESAHEEGRNSTVSTPELSPALSVQSQVSESVSTPIQFSKSKPGIKKQTTKNPVRAAEVLQSYLQDKPRKQPEDQLTKFFQAMELSVRSLPHRLQVETKRQIFQIVNDAELKALTQEQLQSIPPPASNYSVNLPQLAQANLLQFSQANLPQLPQANYSTRNIHQPPYYSNDPGPYGMTCHSNVPVSSTIPQKNHERNTPSNNMSQASQEYQN